MELKHQPFPTLYQKAIVVATIDDEVRAAAKAMFKLCCEHDGVGLAANQVGCLDRLFVMNIAGKPRYWINPSVLRTEGKNVEAVEGCLSLPGQQYYISRPEAIEIEATSLDGNRFTSYLGGIAARCALHEIDHLDGININSKGRPCKS